MMGAHDQANLVADIQMKQTISCKTECKATQQLSGKRDQADTKKSVEGSL